MDAAHPLQGVGDALALGPQLLGIGEVPELTAAAPARQAILRAGAPSRAAPEGDARPIEEQEKIL